MAKSDGMSAKAPAQLSAQERDWAAIVIERIADTILPGDPELAGEHLEQAAALLIEAARKRPDGKPSIVIRTALNGQRVTRIAIVNKDMPFLVDSIGATLSAHGHAIDLLVHPVLPLRRDGEMLVDMPRGDAPGEKRESLIYIETARMDAKARRALEGELLTTILDVRAAVADWPEMREAIGADADRLSDAEGAALLRWLGEGMLTQLGHVTRRREGTIAQVMGICRSSRPDLLADDAYDRAFAWFDGASGKPGRAPLLVKANHISRVHRRVPLDLFIVPVLENGRVEALSVHAGMWTSAALVTAPDRVPVLRQQLQTIMQRLDFVPGSHDYKGLVHALMALPHDLIIGFSDDDITRVATAMMGLADRPRPRATLVTAPLGRHIFAFVWLPRDLLSTAVRRQIEEMLESETGAATLDWSLMVEGGNLALLRYVLDFRGVTQKPDAAAIDKRLQDMLRGWSDAVEDALASSGEPARAAAIAARYAKAFPLYYRTAYGASEAAIDIICLRKLAVQSEQGNGTRAARLYRAQGEDEGRLHLKIYQHNGTLPLSDAVPALENFGFRVLSEVPTVLSGEEAATIHDFTLGLPAGCESANVLARADAVQTAISAVLNALAEDDVFNRLVTVNGLAAQEANWLRAFYRYARQTSIAFTIHTVVDALAGAPAVTRGLIALLRARHDPAFKGDRTKGSEAAQEEIRVGLASVHAINDDRLLRLYLALVLAVLRTNVFTPQAREDTGDAGEYALAFKFDSAAVPGLPRPVPWREIFVFSRRVEGIHLRAGPVARGGLRWSDRRDDFRTEVLGLMKAQKVKNAVIVPTGAKGGFYPKRLANPATDRDAWFAEGRESYKVFIRSLLSITDNIVADKVVHPDHVVIHDGEDPYFVVAADKGTASFSDTANTLAIERGFWLGDAFASGGSNGYDHKAMGITARGAWISVQRHFLELGVDVQKEPITVVGCGDMSGDVFGNGMLLSKAIKLVAAFDHRHIFIDPDPDPALSWKERKRLFGLPRSSWADYAEDKISKGGGVFPRSLKRIDLSPQMQAALGIEEASLDPDSLISAILKSAADLIWFGGIGTYVKAAHESHLDVGDPANDTLRVDAGDLRAKVIGEGANLGVTQAGRIEFSLRGGRMNTDFIDNSAGVDCSDNEVNIKIALAAARKAGLISDEERNALLKDMTGDVAALVLEDNRLQALALSIAEQGGAKAVGAHARLIEMLEERGELDRKTQGLADNEALARRAAEGHGLTRPELAVLLSNAKLALQDAIEASALAQDEASDALVMSDFPEALQERFAVQLREHRLRLEIVGTVVANKIINRMGLIHPFELAEEEGAGLDVIGAAFVASCALLGMDRVWHRLDTASMPEQVRLALFDAAAQALRGHMADLIRASGKRIAPAQLRDQWQPMINELTSHSSALQNRQPDGHIAEIARDMASRGGGKEAAAMVANLFALDGAIGLSALAGETGVAASRLADAFVALGQLLGIDWAQSCAAIMSPEDPWERLLVAGLARDFQHMRLDFLCDLIKGNEAKSDNPGALIDHWAHEHSAAIAQFRRIIERAQAAPPLSAAMLAQIASQARNLLRT